jgi:RNA polymerase sigma factor (sigma-70 family)
MGDGSVRDLLERLDSDGAGAAWTEFLRQYSAVIMQMVRRFESDHGRTTDCFLYVCEQLSNDGFRRLRRFRADGPARFRTWLSAVVANLCVDWRRAQSGRFRPVRAIADLPKLDQLVYRCIYVRGMPRDECLYTLQTQFPDLTDRQLSEINARLFALLGYRQRWQLSVRRTDPLPIEDASADQGETAFQPVEPGPGPEDLSAHEQQRERLAAALARLSPQQRLLLRLRYEQGLTLEEVARLTRIPDPFRAHRQIQAALKSLGDLMGAD